MLSFIYMLLFSILDSINYLTIYLSKNGTKVQIIWRIDIRKRIKEQERTEKQPFRAAFLH